MELSDRGHKLRLATAVFLLVYVGLTILMTMANNNWYPFLTDTFCGSLRDFTDKPVPAVCLSFSEYWFQAAFHPPYMLAGVTLGGVVAGTVAFRAELQAKLPW